MDIATLYASGTGFHLLDVFLDSVDSHFRRTLALARLLQEPRCRGGIIAGGFNAFLPEDHRLVDEHELLDA